MFNVKELTDIELQTFYNTLCEVVCELRNDECEDFCGRRCPYHHLCAWYHSVLDVAYDELERRKHND